MSREATHASRLARRGLLVSGAGRGRGGATFPACLGCRPAASRCAAGRLTRCLRDGPAQDRRCADRDVGDHRRSREHAAAEVGQRSQRAPSRLAAVAAPARCRGLPPQAQLPLHPRGEPGKGLPLAEEREHRFQRTVTLAVKFALSKFDLGTFVRCEISE